VKTLAVFTGGIGDTLLAGPAFAALHRRGPLDVAGYTERLALLQAAGACGKAYDLDRIEFHSLFSKPSGDFKRFIKKYDRIIVWMHDDGSIRKALFDCGVSDCRVFPGIPPEGWPRHAAKYYFECVAEWLPANTRLDPFSIPIKAASKAFGNDVIIHPGSGGAHKNWPLENFTALPDALNREFVWLRGPAEETVRLPVNARVLEPMPLIDLAAILAGANAYIGNDCGITHLAAAAGCPTVAVFGATDPKVWAPVGGQIKIVTGDPWPTVPAVINALASFQPRIR
jgi:heptosyltransferase III